MAEANEIYFDEKSGQVVELVQQPVNPDNFQADLDAAQNAVNEANDAHVLALSELEDAQDKVDSTEHNLEDAKELLAFQEGRKAAYDQALATGKAATQSESETDADDLATDAPVSEAVDLPITLATE